MNIVFRTVSIILTLVGCASIIHKIQPAPLDELSNAWAVWVIGTAGLVYASASFAIDWLIKKISNLLEQLWT